MSIVNVTDNTAPAIMLINAMAREAPRDELLSTFNHPQFPLTHSSVDVRLTINGVEVDFMKTAQEMWDRLRRHHREDVEKCAKELLSQTRFDKLGELIQKVEWEIGQEIEKLLHDREA